MYINKNGQVEDKKINNRIETFLFPTVSLTMANIFLMLGFVDKITGGIRTMAVICGIGLWIVSIYGTGCFARYGIEENGIWAKYLFGKGQSIPWSEFQEVCVCYAAYNNTGGAYVVICFVKHGQKPNARGRWKTDNPFYHRSVITMDYTQELYDEVKEKCPYEIVDLRNTKSYKLNSVIESDIR